MKLWDFVKRAGAAVVRDVVPGGGLVVDLVNEFLPQSEKLPADATGDTMAAAISRLPPEKQAELRDKELSVAETEIKESASTLRAALETEAKSPHTTRPRIALGSFRLTAAVSLIAVSAWAYKIVTDTGSTVADVANGWPFLAAVVAPFVVLLRAYFGVLQVESRDRLDAAGGASPQRGVSAIVGALLKRK